MLGAAAGLIVQIGNDREPHPSETPVRTPARIAYTTHGPISIIGNAGFINASGVVWGGGTESDPYIIEGLDINASTATGIGIQNTDAHFIVRACHVHDGGLYYDAILLDSCVNGTLENNTCSSNRVGIYLLDSSNYNTLSNNNCSNNVETATGIGLFHSCNNTLVNNTCSDNEGYGVCLYFSDGNTLINNTCSNNFFGICVVASNSNTLVNNTCSNSSDYGIYLDTSSTNTLIDNNCLESNLGGIGLSLSSSNTLIGNYCSNGGIELYVSSSNTLIDNNCSNGNCGILLETSSNGNSLINNTCISNSRYGIFIVGPSCIGNSIAANLIRDNSEYGICIIWLSTNNRIWNNTFTYNNGATDTYDAAHIQAIDDGLGNWWNSTDGYGNYWSDWTTPDVAPPDGIVDVPYDVAGGVGAKDYYPLTTPQAPIPEFGMMPIVVTILLAAIFLITGARRRKEHSS